jgi:hypothetical protein
MRATLTKGSGARWRRQSALVVLVAAMAIATRWNTAMVPDSLPEDSGTGITFSHLGTGHTRIPFLVATVTFGTQTVVTCACALVARRMTKLAHLNELQTEDTKRMADLGGVAEALCVYACISLVSFCTYALFTFGSEKYFLIVQDKLHGPHIALRNITWLVSTPLQWYTFGRTCTDSSLSEIGRIMLYTVVMQVAGICVFLSSSSFMWYSMFMISSAAFVGMFWGAFYLDVPRDFETIIRPLLWLELILWIAYPIVLGCAAAGLVGTWTEQVVLFTLLDIGAKSVSLSAILMVYVYVVLSRVNVALQHVGRGESSA